MASSRDRVAGRTEHNKLGLFTGWEDASLAKEGIAEAKRAGQLLRARRGVPSLSPESAQNRKIKHPRPRLIPTSRIDSVSPPDDRDSTRKPPPPQALAVRPVSSEHQSQVHQARQLPQGPGAPRARRKTQGHQALGQEGRRRRRRRRLDRAQVGLVGDPVHINTNFI